MKEEGGESDRERDGGEREQESESQQEGEKEGGNIFLKDEWAQCWLQCHMLGPSFVLVPY